MEFLNADVHPTLLPQVESVDLNPVSPDYFKVVRISWAITSFILLVVVALIFYFIEVLHQPWIIATGVVLYILLCSFLYVWERNAFNNLGYAIREHDIIHRSGWLVTRLRTTPYNRIQHSNVVIGPLERKYNLASLILYTAGSDGADLKISGLTHDQAYQLKQWITEKVLHER